ncbi:aromatic ring-hydroxylating dioxygenase subunit alpha [Nocardia sp. NPDC051750]|uniref:aromatic ring-hydroxylating dioxygenase subunit alpha n=1 Tax=Nocardia sp. NPDC051750 TaxID=3364325 RepID=UPI00379E3C50
MKVPFTWKVTGWFMIGWSAEFPLGETRPLRYFGEDLVAYRDESGEIHVLTGHCKHLGAHIGHGGKVVGDCVECPFHGWRWGPDGRNTAIPGEKRVNRGLRLRVYPVNEQNGCVFMWHHPEGAPPNWAMPDVLGLFPELTVDPGSFYRPYPEFSRKADGEPVHPQVVLENGPDSAHFRYVHRATVTPRMLDWNESEHSWTFLTGWPDVRSADPDAMAMLIHAHMFGLGGSISAFEGSANHRLIFAATPVDDETSDLFYSIWWPKLPGDDSDVPPPAVRERVEKQFLITVWDDLSIWRYQKYVEHPALSPQDAKPYMSLRQWATRFYDVPAETPA